MWQEIVHTIPGPGRVDARFPGLTIPTDHPPEGDREGRAPEPWCLFLASIGTCMASFVAAECERLRLSTDGIRLIQRQETAEDDDVPREVRVDIELPDGFPEEHRAALVDAACRCTVKRTIEGSPRFVVVTVPGTAAEGAWTVDVPFLAALLDSQPDPVLFADTEHIIRWMNRAAESHYTGGASLLGSSILDCHDEASCRVIHEVLDALRSGEDERMITDSEKWRIWMRAVRDRDGRLLGYYERYGPPGV